MASSDALPFDALLRHSSRQLLSHMADLGGRAAGAFFRQASNALSRCAETASFSSASRTARRSVASRRSRIMASSRSAMSAVRASPAARVPMTGRSRSVTRSRRAFPARKPRCLEWKKTSRHASASRAWRRSSRRERSSRVSSRGATASSVEKTGSKSGGRSSSSAVSLTMRCSRLSMVRTLSEPYRRRMMPTQRRACSRVQPGAGCPVPSAVSLRRPMMRSCISAAARLVKVTARISGHPCGPERAARQPENGSPPVSAASSR